MRTACVRTGILLGVAALMLLAACGGGGSGTGTGSGGSYQPPVVQPLTITTTSPLPGTLTGHTYSVTLIAINGTAPLKWSIAKISPTALFPDGLSVDASTGVVSGTANFSGTAGFVATVSDANGGSTTKTLLVTAYQPLQAPATQTAGAGQYSPSTYISTAFQGGVYPLTFSVTGGSLPPGMRLNTTTGVISGSANAFGTYVATVTIRDSFLPPEVVTTQVTLNVGAPSFELMDSIRGNLLVNRPFSGAVVARGGVPPYHLQVNSGSLPPGLGPMDPSSGRISGTPTSTGWWMITVVATDSSSPPRQASWNYGFQVVNPMGRNDSPATATPIGNGMFDASLSPYIDPPNGAPGVADNDYYRLTSLGGNVVHIETWAKRWNQNKPIDTVLEIVDANGFRFSTCRQPGDNSTNFNSVCLNDDIDKGVVQDSLLDFKVPGDSNAKTTFFVRVLDWRGDSRPDMTYTLSVQGVVPPMTITGQLAPTARGLSYSQQLAATNANGAVTWAVADGSLPPGLTLAPAGAITGAATTDGTYNFTMQATDSASPAQVVTAAETIQVVEPVKITSSAVFPDACAGQPYSFAVQASGGAPPLNWSFWSNSWIAINLNLSTGVFSGVASLTGTYTGHLSAGDATGHYDAQDVTLTVKNCQ